MAQLFMVGDRKTVLTMLVRLEQFDASLAKAWVNPGRHLLQRHTP